MTTQLSTNHPFVVRASQLWNVSAIPRGSEAETVPVVAQAKRTAQRGLSSVPVTLGGRLKLWSELRSRGLASLLLTGCRQPTSKAVDHLRLWRHTPTTGA